MMRLEDYVASLPGGIVSGERVQPSERSLREMLGLAGAGAGDTVYHLGCGDGRGLAMAISEFGAARAVGIDSDPAMAAAAREATAGLDGAASVVCGDALDAGLDGATVVLSWFADEALAAGLARRFAGLPDGCRIVTLWGPPHGCLPDSVRFPYVLSRTPLRRAGSVAEQVLAVLGVRCVDFATAWEHAELYTRAVEPPGAQNNRFVTILQTLVMWINARNLGVACGEGVPESIRTYMGILRNFYGIETDHLLLGQGAGETPGGGAGGGSSNGSASRGGAPSGPPP